MFRPSWVIIRALHGQNTKNYRLKCVCNGVKITCPVLSCACWMECVCSLHTHSIQHPVLQNISNCLLWQSITSQKTWLLNATARTSYITSTNSNIMLFAVLQILMYPTSVVFHINVPLFLTLTTIKFEHFTHPSFWSTDLSKHFPTPSIKT